MLALVMMLAFVGLSVAWAEHEAQAPRSLPAGAVNARLADKGRRLFLLDEVRDPIDKRQPEITLAVNGTTGTRQVHIRGQGVRQVPTTEVACAERSWEMSLTTFHEAPEGNTLTYDVPADVVKAVLSLPSCALIVAGAQIPIPGSLVSVVWAHHPAHIAPTGLLLAAKEGSQSKVASLLGTSASPNTRGPGGEIALHWAAAYGHRAIAELLLSKGADVKTRDMSGATPLHYAAEDGHTDVVKLLLDNGADVQAQDDDDVTPLHLAAGNGHNGVADLLLDHRAGIDAQDKARSTPLHIASAHGRTQVVHTLLRRGANQKAKDSDGKTPLDLARANNHPDVVTVIEAFATQQISKGNQR